MNTSEQRVFLCFGTIPQDLPEQTSDRAKSTAEQVGRILARRGFSVIQSGYVKAPSLDAAQAFVNEIGDIQEARQRITTYLPQLSNKRNGLDDQRYKGIGQCFHTSRAPEARRHLMVLDSDVIIALGGRKGTSQNLAVAESLGKPVVPIPVYGGVSADVYSGILGRVRHTGDRQLISLFCDIGDPLAIESVIAESAVEAATYLLNHSLLSKATFGPPDLKRIKGVFLSHSSKDEEMVVRYYRILKEMGFQPWLDQMAISAGMDPARAIQRALNACDGCVFFITKNFRDEGWISSEVDFAVRRRIEVGDRFVLISIRFDERVTVPDMLNSYAYKTVDNDLDALYEILRSLRGHSDLG